MATTASLPLRKACACREKSSSCVRPTYGANRTVTRDASPHSGLPRRVMDSPAAKRRRGRWGGRRAAEMRIAAGLAAGKGNLWQLSQRRQLVVAGELAHAKARRIELLLFHQM